ncbi:MAG TPA: potassium channel family protein [Acidimicrobiia bacterium]|nr:potassium channel family protein [Acidimicrobiia bacterium]
MPKAPRLFFPHGPPDPRRALFGRIGVAFAMLLMVAAVTWLGRGGYRDSDGGPVTLLDALYYASVSVTTTGYGDITPITPEARLLTAIIVTPARIVFLIVLVGTTVELLTERFRASLAESRWRRRVRDHIIVAGYGTKGRGAVETLLANGSVTPDRVVAIDTSEAAVAEAQAAGFTAILGDATRTVVLNQARVEVARAVIVTAHRDDTATLVTLTARELNPGATIAAAVREAENAHLLSQSGATTVVVSSEAAGRLLGLSTESPRAVSVLEDLLVAGRGLELVERPAAPEEVGGPPHPAPRALPVALLRAGRAIPFDDTAFQRIEPGDVVVFLRSEHD